MAVRSARCRGSPPRAPPVSSAKRSSSRASTCEGDSVRSRAAASSRASGIPSRRAHTSASAARFAEVTAKSASAADARAVSRASASSGPGGASGRISSPSTASGRRPAASTRRPGARRSSSRTSSPVSSTSCSKPSRTCIRDGPGRPGGVVGQPEGLGEGQLQQRGIPYGGQLGQPHPVAVAFLRALCPFGGGPGGREDQPGLAHPAHTGHRHQPGGLQEPSQPGEFGTPPDERAQLRGKIAPGGLSKGSLSHGTRRVLVRMHCVQGGASRTGIPVRPGISGAIGSEGHLQESASQSFRHRQRAV